MCSFKTETLLRYFHQEIRALADSYNVKFVMSNKVGALADRFRICCCSAPKSHPLPPSPPPLPLPPSPPRVAG